MSNPLIVYSRSKSAFAEQVTSGEVDSSQVGLIGNTGEVWMGGEYRPLHCDIYVTEFTLADCDAAIANGGDMQIASQSIWDAVAANKIIFIPRGNMGGGCAALSSISDDFVYLTCVDNYNAAVYYIEVPPPPYEIGHTYSVPWFFELRTINGELLFGNGNIELAPTETIGGGKYVRANGIADSALAYALPTSANGDEDDVIATGSTLKTINGQSLLGSGDIVIEGGTAASGVYIADFYMHQLWGGEYIPFDIQALQEAIEANKIIYIPYDENDGRHGGCVATALIDDMIYLTIFSDMGYVYLVEIDFGSTDIDPQRITKRYPIDSINDLPAGPRMVIRPRQRKLSISNGQTLALVLHDYFSIVQPLSSVTLLLPSVVEENNVQQCGVTFTTGTSTPVVRYQGGTIWWEGGVAPTIEVNTIVEFVFTWHWQKSVWLGKCTIYKSS